MPKALAPRHSKDQNQDAYVSELMRIRARSPQALARWIPVPAPVPLPVTDIPGDLGLGRFQEVTPSNGSGAKGRKVNNERRTVKASASDAQKQSKTQFHEVEASTTKAANQCQDAKMPKTESERDTLWTEVRSVSNCILKKLRQERPYYEPSQDTRYDGIQTDGGMMDSNWLMCKIEQRTKDIEELLQAGEELLQNSKAESPSSMILEDSEESPAKRLHNESNSSFISLSNSIDELCQQLSILSKECDLRYSAGFGTPNHSRTSERLQLLAETTDVLHAIYEKAKDLADAHRNAEGLALTEASPYLSHVTSASTQLHHFDADEGHQTPHDTSSVQHSKHVHFHLDDELPEVSNPPTWMDFDMDDLPEDGLQAFPLARSPVALNSLWSFMVRGSPSPSRGRTVTTKESRSFAPEFFPKNDHIQGDTENLKSEPREAETKQKQMSESLTRQRWRTQGLENRVEKTQQCQPPVVSSNVQVLPVQKRYVSALCT